MSETMPRTDGCGCCASDEKPPQIFNAPGLTALSYRVGTYSDFRDRVLRSLPSVRPDAASTAAPLGQLTVRTTDDPTVALVDAFAQVADVLTFYQERIANEGYLRTATERRSVLELARAIGYELSPGVAASAWLSFTVEDAPGAPRQSLIARGTQVQSVPPQGKLPQVFETSVDFTARAEWNRLRPRLTRPADVAILLDAASPADHKLVLLVPAGSVPPEVVAAANVTDERVRRLNGEEIGPDALDAVEISRLYLTEAASGVSKGELLLFAGAAGSERAMLLRRVVEVLAEPESRRVRVDVEPLGASASGTKRVPYSLAPVFAYTAVKLAPMAFSGSAVRSGSWRERDLSAMIGIQNWSGMAVATAVNTPQPARAAPPGAGLFAFREKTAFFGHNAPKWSSLPGTGTNGVAYARAWDAGDEASVSASRTVWQDSQGNLNRTMDGVDAWLERAVTGIVPGSWIVICSKSLAPRAWGVHNVLEGSRADFGISGRSTAVILADPTTGLPLSASPSETEVAFGFREALAYVGSHSLAFAELPVESPVLAGTKEIELDALVLGLAPGQAIALTGLRHDVPGLAAAEVQLLKDVVHSRGRTILILETGLKYSYVRKELGISANVVPATHGETVQEVLGSGDAARRNQHFVLSKPPLTYVSAPTTRGSASTLEIRVNEVLWEELPSLYGASASTEGYVVRIDDDARAHVTFGDGISGARVPSGVANIKARYRSGIGADAEVEAGTLTIIRTLPLGIRGATNPLPASGAEDPEKLADARRNAPRTVLTFERVVSLLDFEDFARTYPGVGKASADVLWIDGAWVIHVTITGATGPVPGDTVLANLATALSEAGDGSQRFRVSACAPRFFNCTASLAIHERYRSDLVLTAAADKLRAAFSFDARGLSQPVTAAEVLSLLHEVPGVVAVDLDYLAPYTEEGASFAPMSLSELPPLVARRASWDAATRAVLPAELLLVNPVGIELSEMTR
jgi:predicted phage baseplate assembly protein